MSVWDSVIDQEKVCLQLQEAAAASSSAMTHAWLITGPPGSGRSTAAQAFAAALECDNGGCGTCNNCVTVMNNTHRDVTKFTTNKVIISIDEVTHLLEHAQLSPVQGQWQIIIIEDADRMTERTSNLLLKSLEEPPERTVWILCAPSPQDVLVTIRSRCRHVNLRIPSYDAVADLLVKRHGVDRDTAMTAAHIAQAHIGVANAMVKAPQTIEHRRLSLQMTAGVRSVSDAVYMAEQLVWYSKNSRVEVDVRQERLESGPGAKKKTKKSKDVLAEDVEFDEEKAAFLKEYGYEDDKNLPRTIQKALRDFTDDYKRRHTRRERDVIDRVLQDLLSLYRDVYCQQVGADSEPINFDMQPLINDLARQSSPQSTVKRMDVINATRERLQSNAQTLLLLEAMLIELRPQGAHPFIVR